MVQSRIVVLAALSLAFPLQAQTDFPNKPVRILVGFPAASTADIIARQLAGRLSETIGQQVLLENRAGAGSSIAAEAVALNASTRNPESPGDTRCRTAVRCAGHLSGWWIE